jgi:peptide chain release factor subunit 1
MLAVLDEYHRSSVAVVDREVARIFELFQGEMQETGRLARSGEPVTRSGDPDKMDQKLEELTKKHFRQVVTMLDQQYRDAGFELLIVGGYQPEVPRFLEFLTHELQPLVAGTFPIDEHAKSSPAEIKQQATAIVDRYERDEEKRMVAEVMEKVAAHGLGALGIPLCLWAGSVAAVNCLLVQDGAIVPGVICDQDRWLALRGETCPLCGRPVRHVPDLVDELTEMVIDDGGSVEHVSVDTPLKDHVLGAYLRFKLPDPPPQLA